MTNPRTRPLTIITGAASGIGAAVARRIAATGPCALIDIDGEACRRVAAAIGEPAEAIALDITDTEVVQHAIAAITARHASIGGLVNAAGGGIGAALAELDRERWDAMLALNLTGTFNMLHAALPHFNPTGAAIVNVASIAAWGVSPKGGAAYAAAKAGVLALSRQAAAELAPRGIRVNTVLPGPTRTELTKDSVLVDSDFPLGRWVEADDVARPIAWLLSQDAAMCTGCELLIDGGWSVRMGIVDQINQPPNADPY